MATNQCLMFPTSWVAYEFLISTNIVPEQASNEEKQLFELLVSHFRVLCCNSKRKAIFMIELLTRFHSGLTFDFQADSNIENSRVKIAQSYRKRQNVVGHSTSEFYISHFTVRPR